MSDPAPVHRAAGWPPGVRTWAARHERLLWVGVIAVVLLMQWPVLKGNEPVRGREGAMRCERIEDKGLAQYSYIIACDESRRMAVIDPRRDIDVYLAIAERDGYRISDVLETHIHADYASGASELARRTGATCWASGHDVGEDYEVQFPHRDLDDGDAVELGTVTIQALHTPGHTPEHLSYVVTDRGRASHPTLLLTGDFLFVGSVGRPDLLGDDASRGLAQRLFASVQRLHAFGDEVQILPAHGAGSMCGSGMSARPTSTLGQERATNPYLDPRLTEDAFVERLLADAPPLPPYYRRMKALNARGPRRLDGLPPLARLTPESVRALVDEGAVVLDTRVPALFGDGHIPGAFGIGAGEKLSMWAAWVVPYDRPIVVVADEEQRESVIRSLVRVGLDDIRGVLEGGITAWVASDFAVTSTPQISASDLAARLGHAEAPAVLDVRTDEEWSAGHVASAQHIMGGLLPGRTGEVPRDRPVAVMCGSGYRSTVAASVLERHGFTNVVNVVGGLAAWEQAGLPTEGT